MAAVLVVRKVSLTCRLIVESAVERGWARMVGERGSRARGCVEGFRGPGAGGSVFSETEFRRWVFMSSGRAVKHVKIHIWSCQVVALPNLKKSAAPQALFAGAVRQLGGAESVLETIGSKSAEISTKNIKFESTFHWLRASFLFRVARDQIFDITKWHVTQLTLQSGT